MANSLETLPAELLTWILDKIDHLRDVNVCQNALWALSLTSKHCYRAATPYLYRVISPNIRLPRLLSTISATPALADRIERLSLSRCREQPSRLPSAEEVAFSRQSLVPIANRDVKEDIVVALCRGCQTANGVLLLSLAKRVRHLEIEWMQSTISWHSSSTSSCTWCPDIAQSFGATVAAQSSAYSNLISGIMRGDKNGTLLPALSPLSTLATLQALECRDFYSVTSARAWPATSSALRDLKLVGCTVSIEDLEDMINSCDQLRVFHYRRKDVDSFGEDDDFAIPAGGADSGRLLTALTKHASTLEDLAIIELDGSEPLAPFASLAHLHSIRTLEITESLLVGADLRWDWVDISDNLLPGGLTSLTVHSWEDSLQKVDIILSACRSAYQGIGLTDLRITFVDWQIGWTPHTPPDLRIFLRCHPAVGANRRWCASRDDYNGESRVVFRFRGQPIWPVVDGFTKMLAEFGMEDVLKLQAEQPLTSGGTKDLRLVLTP